MFGKPCLTVELYAPLTVTSVKEWTCDFFKKKDKDVDKATSIRV